MMGTENKSKSLLHLEVAKGRLPRRSDFLSGKVKAFFAPGQTQLSTVGEYGPPTDWPKAGSLISPQRMVWITIDFGVLDKRIYSKSALPPGKTGGAIYTKYAQIMDKTEAFTVYSTTGEWSTHPTTYHYGHDEFIQDFYGDSPSENGSYSAVDHPLAAQYRQVRESMESLVRSIPAASGGRWRATLLDYTILQVSNADITAELVAEIPFYTRENYSGGEAINDKGERICDFIDLDPSRLASLYESNSSFAELPVPPSSEGFLGSEFLHIYIGGLQPQVTVSDPTDLAYFSLGDFNAATRVSMSGIIDKIGMFPSYKSYVVGISGYTRLSSFPFDSPPVRQIAVAVPSSDSYLDHFETVYGTTSSGGTLAFSSYGAGPYIIYVDHQYSQSVLDSQYDDAVAAYEAASTETPVFVPNSDVNNVLASECDILAGHGFKYLGDTSQVPVSEIEAIVLSEIQPPEVG